MPDVQSKGLAEPNPRKSTVVGTAEERKHGSLPASEGFIEEAQRLRVDDDLGRLAERARKPAKTPS